MDQRLAVRSAELASQVVARKGRSALANVNHERTITLQGSLVGGPQAASLTTHRATPGVTIVCAVKPSVRRLVALLTAFVLLVAACGSDGDGAAVSTTTTTPSTSVSTSDTTSTTGPSITSGSVTTTDTIAATQFADIFFVQGNGYAIPVVVAVPAGPALARNAILALIAGPTETQRADGLSSSVPPDTVLLGLTIRDGLALVDLSRQFESGGGTFSMTARLAQVVYTLTQFSTVDEVEFWLEGQAVTVFSSEGLVLDGPVSRADYLAALPLTPSAVNAAELWEQADLPDLGDRAETRRVVLVAANDVLNVRRSAGVDNEIIGMLVPGVEVALTGPQTNVGTSTWFEIVTPVGAGWVNGRFLAEIVDDAVFTGAQKVLALLDDLAAIITAKGDLNEVASARGLYISHHGAPVRFGPDKLAAVLTDETSYKWPSNALDVNDPDQAAEIRAQTFAVAIGDSFVSAWNDPDRMVAWDKPLAGGNGRLSSYAIPAKLSGFHYLSVHDPGDNPEYEGLDWISWHVSIDYENGTPVVVGLTLDQWSP